MRKTYVFIFLTVFILIFGLKSNSQTGLCIGVTVEAFPNNPQSGSYNFFGVRVTLDQTYDHDITVTGYIYDDGSPSTNNPYSLTVTAGNLSAETSSTYYQTCPACTGAASLNGVSPTTVTKGGVVYNTQPEFNCETFFENFLPTYNLNLLSNPDSTVGIAHMIDKNDELVDYLTNAAPNTYDADSLVADSVVVFWAAIIHAIAIADGNFIGGGNMPLATLYPLNGSKIVSGPNDFEYQFNYSNSLIPQGYYRIDWNCVKNVVLGFFDLVSLVEDYVALIQSGGSWSTVRGLIWRTVKRYAGWGAAAALIYEIATECF
jgi:hypothetical protein